VREFVTFAQSEIRKIPPLQCVLSFDEWLESCPYTKRTKDELRLFKNELDDHLAIPSEPGRKNGFPKTERYPTYKHFRGIAACTKFEKVFLGPLVKTVEKHVCSWWPGRFLKGLPTNERAAWLMENLPGDAYLGLDFTSFESSILREYAVGIESFLFEHLAGNICPDECAYYLLSSNVNRKIVYHDFRLIVHHGRCSGDMQTSICNGIINLLLVRFVCSRLGYDPLGVVEGDDGLFAIQEPYPESAAFAQLGFVAKIEIFHDLGTAGFCKMKFTPDGVQVTDIVEKLVKFGWTSDMTQSLKRKWCLLWTKALSLKAEYPDCPVIGPFSDWVISCCLKSGVRLSRVFDEDRGWTSYKLVHSSSLHRPAKVSDGAREFVYQIYDLSIAEQVALEAEFKGPIHPIPHSLLQRHLPSAWVLNWIRYVCPFIKL